MKNKILLGTALTLTTLALLSSCSNIPKNAKPIESFDANRYLGTWYEIARFDYKFERNLDNVTAQYSFKENGEIKVLNSGYNTQTQEWKSATGSAKFRKDKTIAALKVSFFKPFYAGYNVIALDKDYKYALVAGQSLKYLWILSREKSIPENIKEEYLKKAQSIGYDTSKLIWVKQDKNNPFVHGK
ncbi:apolipoprotein D and lipocalin family protein [Elizabethkingia sp. YR214]|uniref:lipocalin family protein n=1 Tax=Elizabethkingia sp. YR214 TaxID=2135667 RepID=UPI000D31A90F|nr:lipocalin family protein [Elizabethkingia sp. YR214]PUB34367.1 apolipoprotein D and lipocalin family protein [Elizabethkingia sp. YR214]